MNRNPRMHHKRTVYVNPEVVQKKEEKPKQVFLEKNNADIVPKYEKTIQKRNNVIREYDYTKNEPYKLIINDQKKIYSVDDFKIDVDKKPDVNETKKKMDDLMKDRNYTDSVTKKKYSKDKEEENKKTFEYRNHEIYNIKYDSKDHTLLKQDRMNYYQNEQKKLEEYKEDFNSLLENLKNKGILK